MSGPGPDGARLGYLLKKFPRLSETFVLNEILGQEALGARLHVFSRRGPDAEPAQPQIARLQAAVEVMPHASEIDPWSELFGDLDDELLPRIRATLADLRPLGHARLPALMAEAIWLRRRTRELGLQHLHVHFATDSAVTALLLQRLGGPSYSITCHAKDIYRSSVHPGMLDRLVGESRFVVTVCDANVQHMGTLVSPRSAEKIRRLYNGIDLSLFDAALDLPQTREPRTIVSVGRLVEKKGFDVLIDALALLAARGEPFRARIAGDGEERAAIEARIAARGLLGSIELVGAVDQLRVRELLASATLFCLPCKIGEDGNRDALPTVLLEALAAGLPCISTPITGIPEILDQGRAGVLVPENDVPATAAALSNLLGQPERRASLAAAGIRRARQLFDGRIQSRTLNGWFDSVLQEVTA